MPSPNQRSGYTFTRANERRTRAVRVLLTADEHRSVMETCVARNEPFSSFAREVILREMQRLDRESRPYWTYIDGKRVPTEAVPTIPAVPPLAGGGRGRAR